MQPNNRRRSAMNRNSAELSPLMTTWNILPHVDETSDMSGDGAAKPVSTIWQA